jgi:hypothetical protein
MLQKKQTAISLANRYEHEGDSAPRKAVQRRRAHRPEVQVQKPRGGTAMRTKRLLCLGMWALGAGAFVAVSPVRLSGQQNNAAVRIDNNDIGGVVTSAKGPEAGVWVIAETTVLPTKFAKVVVTTQSDDGPERAHLVYEQNSSQRKSGLLPARVRPSLSEALPDQNVRTPGFPCSTRRPASLRSSRGEAFRPKAMSRLFAGRFKLSGRVERDFLRLTIAVIGRTGRWKRDSAFDSQNIAFTYRYKYLLFASSAFARVDMEYSLL